MNHPLTNMGLLVALIVVLNSYLIKRKLILVTGWFSYVNPWLFMKLMFRCVLDRNTLALKDYMVLLLIELTFVSIVSFAI